MSDLPDTITVSIVDDDEAFVQSVRHLVNGHSGMKCLSFFYDGSIAIKELPNNGPDVVLVDLQMRGTDGIQCIRKLRPVLPNTLFLVLTSHNDDEHVFESLKAGATGYLLKRSAPSEVLQAIVEVTEGGSPMTSYIARRVVQSFLSQNQNPLPSKPETILSAREEEILKLLTQGYLYKEIANQLHISLDTVRTHIRRIYQKLQVRSRTEAVVKYLES